MDANQSSKQHECLEQLGNIHSTLCHDSHGLDLTCALHGPQQSIPEEWMALLAKIIHSSQNLTITSEQTARN